MGEAVSAALAIGVGCRRGCPTAAIVTLVQRARALCEAGAPARLFTIADKRNEPGLKAAASTLHLDLVFLPGEALAAASAGTVTPSPASQARFGLPSISEAAALAGAGPGARLLVARMAADGATCAIAAGSA